MHKRESAPVPHVPAQPLSAAAIRIRAEYFASKVPFSEVYSKKVIPESITFFEENEEKPWTFKVSNLSVPERYSQKCHCGYYIRQRYPLKYNVEERCHGCRCPLGTFVLETCSNVDWEKIRFEPDPPGR